MGQRNGDRLRRPLRERLSYANVMSTIAVFGVLAGGGAYAASTINSKDIAVNAVRSKHIKAGHVKRSDLAANAVASAKVADGSLGAADLGGDAVGTSEVSDNSLSAADIGSDAVGSSEVSGDSLTAADLAADAIGSPEVSNESLTGADINEETLSLPAPPSEVTVRRVNLVEGDVSDPILFERGDWRFTTTCADDPNSGFPIGTMYLRYLHADDGTVATALVLGGGPGVTLQGGTGGNTFAQLVQSNTHITGQFFAADDFSAIRGLVSLRIPSRSGAYAGQSQCQFELVVLG